MGAISNDEKTEIGNAPACHPNDEAGNASKGTAPNDD